MRSLTATINKQIHTYNTRNNKDNSDTHRSKLSVAGCIFYIKLPNKIKQNPVYKGIKKFLIKGCCYSTEDSLNEEFSNTGY
jgi:hypothetical protein